MDKIQIEILEDGTLKVTTNSISPANHIGAEAFLRDMSTLCGGKVERKAREGHAQHGHSHTHGNGHYHTH